MQLKYLLKRTFKGLDSNLLDRYRKYRNSLFILLHRMDVHAHNNACERALIQLQLSPPPITAS